MHCVKVSTSLKLFNIPELARSANIAVRQPCKHDFIVFILTPLGKSERDGSQSRGVCCGTGWLVWL